MGSVKSAISGVEAEDAVFLQEVICIGIKKGIRTRTLAIITMRSMGYTLREVGIAFGISPERVRGIEIRAYQNLKHWAGKWAA